VTKELDLVGVCRTNMEICLRLETRNGMKAYKIEAPIADSSVWYYNTALTSEIL